MQKIGKLHLENFKFFYGKRTLDFDRKNILVYGENGSGKSSIYWALYTFLQSVFKDDVEIQKYFDISNEQNLVNRFAKNNANCKIELEFEDELKSVITRQISHGTINTKIDSFVKETSITSDFIHYRLLSSIYNYSNRDEIDLFPMFRDHILMFLNFTTEFKPGNSNVADWWDYLKDGMQPRTKMRDPDYIQFQHLIGEFNREFGTYLNKILESANEYLQLKFKEPLKLHLRLVPTSYDSFDEGSSTKRNHKTLPPKIIMTVEYTHDKLEESKSSIKRPHSFLNEARLTSIALAIRFAILDEKYIEQAPKILVLDDLLVSLDMSNRDVVLELIINAFKKYQIIIMTHDRSFFNLCKKRLEYENCVGDWIVKEIYQDEVGDIPQPFIPKNQDYLDRAEKYLREFDYPACANYLRKETERLLKFLLPKNKTVAITDDEGTKPLQLDTLIDNFKKQYREYGGDFQDFKKLKEYKDLLLNPLSHDNIDTPIFRLELMALKKLILKLRTLDYRKLVSIDDSADTFVNLSESDSSEVNWIYRIQLKEHLRGFKLLDGSWRLNNPECCFVKRKNISNGTNEELNIDDKLSGGYRNIRHALRIADEKDLFDIIKVKKFDDSVVILRDILTD